MSNLILLPVLALTVASHTLFPALGSPKSPVTQTAPINQPLHTAGPYFTYLKTEGDHQSIIYTDPDGSGRKEVALPADVQIESLDALSPDGTHIAYYTGSEIDPQVDAKGNESYNLTLNIFNLSTGQVDTTIPLLSSDFPNNFDKAAEILNRTDPNAFVGTNLRDVFSHFIRTMSWSPSGRYLAFAGQMNGLSSNVYVFDLHAKAIQQLSDGPEEVASIGSWSPDEQQFNYRSTFSLPGMGDEAPGTSYVAHLNGNSELYTYHPHGLINNLSDYENAFVATVAMGSMDSLRVYDGHAKTVDIIWDECLFDFAADRQSRTILFAPMTDGDEDTADTRTGLMLYDRQTGAYTPIPEAQYEGWNVQPWHTPTFRYLAHSFDGLLLAVTATGKAQVISDVPTGYSVSPDNKWLAVYSQGSDSLKFYTPDAKLAVELKDLTVDRLIWQANSQALFVKSSDQLLYLSTTDFKPAVVDSGLDNSFDYAWTTKVGK